METRASVRLNKFISESGVCSRREADSFIEQGQVTLNGRRAQMGDQVMPGDEVRLQGRLIAAQDKQRFVFIALNKPVGVVCTTDPAEPDNITKFVGHKQRIFPIGRLDKDSQGLIFLTSNGDLVNKILRAGNQHEKEYLVTVDQPVTPAFLQGMANGVPILGTRTKRCQVHAVASHSFRIILVEGMNRQIRRMCEYFGYRVRKLERTRIMHIRLGGLPVGQWRNLTSIELQQLLQAIAHSTGLAPEGQRSRRPKPVAGQPSGQRAKTAVKPRQGGEEAERRKAVGKLRKIVRPQTK